MRRRRHGATARPEWWSVAVAVALTAAGGSFSFVSVRALRRLDAERPVRDERTALVQLEPPSVVPEVMRAPPALASARPRAPEQARGPIDAASAAAPPVPIADSVHGPAQADGALAVPSRTAAAVERSAAPFAGAARAAVRLPGFALLDSAARDSIERLAGRHQARAWGSWTMPATIVDEDWRREHERVSDRIADKRPWIVSGGPRSSGPVAVRRAPGGGVGVSIPAPVLASGPSRKQRARDSVVHAGNVERLARIFERARARRDSAATPRDSTRH